jgi:GNAT superfamily N-acetyltransferase
MMYEDVICAKTHRERIRIFIAEEDGHIVGWSSVLLPGAGNEFPIPYGSKFAPIYTYINRAYRGLGLGKRLLRMSYNFLRKRRYKPTVFYWGDASHEFFKRVKKEHAPKLQIHRTREWWDIYD